METDFLHDVIFILEPEYPLFVAWKKSGGQEGQEAHASSGCNLNRKNYFHSGEVRLRFGN